MNSPPSINTISHSNTIRVDKDIIENNSSTQPKPITQILATPKLNNNIINSNNTISNPINNLNNFNSNIISNNNNSNFNSNTNNMIYNSNVQINLNKGQTGNSPKVNDSEKLKAYVNKKPMNIIPIQKIETKLNKSNSPTHKTPTIISSTSNNINVKEINMSNYQTSLNSKSGLSPQNNQTGVNSKINTKYADKVFNNIQMKIQSTSPKHYK
jgi:hypothetical protein